MLKPWTRALERYYLYELEEVEGGVRSRVEPEHIKEEADNLTNYTVAEFYPRIECPVLILRAPEGMTTPDNILLPEEALEKMLREIPNARHVDIPGANHYSIVMQPDKGRDAAILAFLE
jgi:pimeloyl-ACP methyl ester carboxylesterase